MQVKTADIYEIRRVLHYDKDTGIFTRKIKSRTQKVGDVAGSRIESSTKPGKFYIRVGVLGKYFWAHRLAIAWVTGRWPDLEVDHKDQNSENNAWDNLIEVTKSTNAKNLSRYQNNTSGFPGVTVRPNGKYRARLMVNSKSISLGDWDTPEEAALVRDIAKKTMGSMKTIAKETALTKAQFLTGVINSIKKKYPGLRQDSKPVTFALQYAGTARTLVSNSGFAEEEAQGIYGRYHNLYKVSAIYAEDKKAKAAKDGHAEVAFGLRVRTPLMAQVMWGSSRVPQAAKAEGRTLGNALSQSYGLLNNRAANAFMKKVWASKYRLDIKMVALIHDAIYLLIRDDLEVVTWANKELIECMRWQELPEIQHETVKLGAALDIFWPDWAHPITLINDASQEEIKALCMESKNQYLKKAA